MFENDLARCCGERGAFGDILRKFKGKELKKK